MKNNKLDKNTWCIIILYSVILTIALVFLAGCRTEYVPVPEYHVIHDTIKSVERKDSIVTRYIEKRDSSSFRREDSIIYIERWHWERDYTHEQILQAKIDSLSHIQADSIPYPVPFEVRVPAELKWWQKALVWWGVICLVFIIMYIFIKIKFPIK